jgi:hypothetical protein
MAPTIYDTSTRQVRKAAPKTQTKSSMPRQKQPITSSAPHESALTFRRLPNEILKIVLYNLTPVDTVCFALASKDNYQIVTEAYHQLPKQLVPFEARSFSAQLTIFGKWPYLLPMKPDLRRLTTSPHSGKGSYRALIRRLALYVPTDDLWWALTRRYGSMWEHDLKTQHSAWKRNYFRELRNARMQILTRLREMDGVDEVDEGGE